MPPSPLSLPRPFMHIMRPVKGCNSINLVLHVTMILWNSHLFITLSASAFFKTDPAHV